MNQEHGKEQAALVDKKDDPIPMHWAFQLCEMICRENRLTRFSLAKLICRRCQNNPAKMGFARRSDNRACFLVNARQAHYRWAFRRPPD